MLQLLSVWSDFIDLIQVPPHSLWFIILISIGVAGTSTLLTRLLVDQDKADRTQKVVSDHAKTKKALLKLSETNPKRYAKEYARWQRRDASIKKMQQGMTMDRLKPSCITMIPIIVFFYAVRAIYIPDSGVSGPVALPAMNPMDDFPAFLVGLLRAEFFSAVGNITVEMGFLGFTGFYMLCSFTSSALIGKIFKTTAPKAEGGSLFDSSAQADLPKPSEL